MSKTVNASFEVKDWKEEPFDNVEDAAKVTRAKVARKYSGDIESFTEWLMAYGEDGSAIFVGLERISARVGERSGTFVVRHSGSYENGAATADLRILENSGSDGLRGITGHGDFVADPGGKVNRELHIP